MPAAFTDMRAAQAPVAFFVNGIGDCVMTLPALRALARTFGSRLALVGPKFAEDYFFPPLGAGRVLTVTTLDAPSGRQFDAAELAARIDECDLLVSLNPWHVDAVDALLARLRPRASIGFFPAFTNMLPLDYEVHAAELAFSAVRALDGSLDIHDFVEPLTLPASASRRARELRSLLPRGARVLAVHGDTFPEKMWEPETIRQGIHAFLEQRPEYWAFVVGLSGLGLEQGRCEARVIDCRGMRLANSMALVGTADLFCGVDSSMLHVADLCRVPTVGLFRSTNPDEFGCLFALHRHLDASRDAGTIAACLLELAVSPVAATAGGVAAL